MHRVIAMSDRAVREHLDRLEQSPIQELEHLIRYASVCSFLQFCYTEGNVVRLYQ